MYGIDPRNLRAAQHFLHPAKNTLINGYIFQALKEVQDEGKFALILHRGPGGILKATAGSIDELNQTATHVKVKLTNASVTPLAVVSFVGMEMVKEGKITQAEFNDLFDPQLTCSVDDRGSGKDNKELELGYSKRAVMIIPFELKDLFDGKAYVEESK